MALRIKHRISHYKIHRTDIWGFLKLSARPHQWYLYRKVSRFFLKVKRFKSKGIRFFTRPFNYEYNAILPKRSRKRVSWHTTSLSLVLVYYLTITQKSFKKMARIAYRKHGDFESNFLILLEGRLASFLYRSSLISNIFDSIKIIKSSLVLVDFKYIDFPNYSAKLYEMVTFNILIKSFIYMDLLVRMRLRRYLFHPANYIFMSFNLMYFYMYKLPLLEDIILTCPVDIFRATSFAYKYSGDRF